MNIDFCKAEIKADMDEEEPKFDSPYRSEWIVSVDDKGYVDIMRWPNIHPGYLDEGINAEMLGMPEQVEDPAGVYKWICSRGKPVTGKAILLMIGALMW
ncbi:hypothetical protein IANJMKHF_00442 [Klebsiella phage CPRSA]|nr:hypothetical protein IANJMKHF_00442 [Klebsiella phage CPRSA]